jgi:branched-chain amino acid transport system permease protein
VGTAIVIGLFQGAVYGLLAVGIVLVYKGTRAFNFAQAEFGTVAAFLMFFFLDSIGLPYPVAFLLSLMSAVALGLLVERLVVRPLQSAPRVTLLVATAGLAIFFIQLELLIAGVQGRGVPKILTGDFVFLGAAIEKQQLLVFVALVSLALLLGLFFKRTNLGIAILALSQDPTATRIVGVNTNRLSAFIWGTAAGIGGLAGLLQIPVASTGLLPGKMTSAFLIPAFIGAVIGGMTSLPGAFLGGEIIGIAQQLASYVNTNYFHGVIPGEQQLLVFSLLMIVLLLRPQGLLGTKES